MQHCRCRSPHAICPCIVPMYPSHARCPCTPSVHGAHVNQAFMLPMRYHHACAHEPSPMRPHAPLPCRRPARASRPPCASDLLIMHGAHAPRHARHRPSTKLHPLNHAPLPPLNHTAARPARRCLEIEQAGTAGGAGGGSPLPNLGG